jgi:Uma2 family endonuclease
MEYHGDHDREGVMALGVRIRRFSVDEYHQMVRAGILKEDDRVELLEGEIIEMAPIGPRPRHAFCVDQLSERLGSALRGRAVIRIQGPISLGPSSELQPDVVLLRPPITRYRESHPQPADVFLVIEGAESSVDDDRARKLPLYARVGVPEAWLVNLPAQAIGVYREPAREGYRNVRTVERGQRLAPEAFPDVTLAVDEIVA